jgi:M6 family metalloprotease-like protein
MNIKKIFTFCIVCNFVLSAICFAAPVFNAPTVRIQPNGDTLHCLLSGDEYYHRLHDTQGYTIVQNPQSGWWVYAAKSEERRTENGERWNVVATEYVAGSVDPASVGLMPNIGVDRETWHELQKRYDVPKQYQHNQAKTSGRNHGTLNNIVIFIRFSDETEISTSLNSINAMFNDSTSGSTSMYNYFKTVSYNKLHILTHYYPTPNGSNVISFQDSLPRSYYMPYNATTNPNGYQNDTESRNREFSLLQRAVNYVNANSPVSTTLNLDMDNDGYVDNICFVVKGTYTGWSDLLWPHKWSLYDRYVYINGKRVYTFNLQLEGSGEHYFSSSTFCHEMFHTLGAPDLYRYENNTDVSGVGSWDLMCSNTTPPQNMGAYMKWKYGNWLDSIPTITIPGTYTLHSLGDPTYDNCVYKIAAQEPNQWYVLEYRDNLEQFETTLPGRGLLIYRIDDRFNGNANFDGVNTFDEVYLFRPNAHNDTTNGNLAQAYFSANAGRTQFSPTSNPHPWLTDNVIDSTISITNISAPGTTISFTYNDLRGCIIPDNLSISNLGGNTAQLHWTGNAPSYTLQWKVAGGTSINNVNVNSTSHTLTGLALDTDYEWRVKGNCGIGSESGYSDWHSFHTYSCTEPQQTDIGTAETTYYYLPVNTYYNYTYSQMIYTAAEIGTSMNINKIAFNYATNNTLDTKTNCTIYMGNTPQSTFSGANANNFVPINQLQVVYQGPLNCTTGWNEIALDNNFAYSDTSNLVIAIDDNSGSYNSSSYKFACSSTSGYASLTFYSDNSNPDPSNLSSFSGTKTRKNYRPDIRFTGCPIEDIIVMDTITVVNATPTRGSVTGEGVYMPGSTVTLSATANTGSIFSCWIFPGNDTVTANPCIFTSDGSITVEAHFAAITHTVTITADGNGTYEGDGTYEYGDTATISASADEHWHFLNWTVGDSQYSDNPLTFIVTSDVNYTAHFEKDKHHITISTDGNSSQWGEAAFNTEEYSLYATDAYYDYGTLVTLYANPFNDIPNTLCTFTGWNDGNSDNPRVITLTQDTAFTAFFAGEVVGIDATDGSNIVIGVANHSVTVSGAEGRNIELFDITGRTLHRATGCGIDTFAMPAVGVYIIRIEGIPAKKIVIK